MNQRMAAPVVESGAQSGLKVASPQNPTAGLLSNARYALSRDQLMTPPHDNAYNWFQQVLAIDEANAEAHRGMRQITERYLELARQAFASGRYAQAEQMLQGAGKVAATPAQLAAVRQAYPPAPQPRSGRIVMLSAEGLAARSDNVLRQLQQMAIEAKDNNLRMIITARNDKEGRWIYQQMREAVSGYRLRGNIEIGATPKVVLMELEASL